MPLLLITVRSRVSAVPLHPGAKLSNGRQWKPRQNSVWATALKVTDEDAESHRRVKHPHWHMPQSVETLLDFRQVFLFIHNAVKAILST